MFTSPSLVRIFNGPQRLIREDLDAAVGGHEFDRSGASIDGDVSSRRVHRHAIEHRDLHEHMAPHGVEFIPVGDDLDHHDRSTLVAIDLGGPCDVFDRLCGVIDTIDGVQSFTIDLHEGLRSGSARGGSDFDVAGECLDTHGDGTFEFQRLLLHPAGRGASECGQEDQKGCGEQDEVSGDQHRLGFVGSSGVHCGSIRGVHWAIKNTSREGAAGHDSTTRPQHVGCCRYRFRSCRGGCVSRRAPDAWCHGSGLQQAGTTPGSFLPSLRTSAVLGCSPAPILPACRLLRHDGRDFLPEGWAVEFHPDGCLATDEVPNGCGAFLRGVRARDPAGARPTRNDHAEMRRVAEREPYLTPEQIRDEIAAGRLIIPANVHHLEHNLDPMCIGRASRTKVNANMGASPVSSGTDEEVEKLAWAERWGGDTVMDLSTGGDLDACREAIIEHSNVPIGTVPIYSMIIGRSLDELDAEAHLSTVEHQAKQGVDYFTIHAGLLRSHIPFVKDRLIGIVSRGGSLGQVDAHEESGKSHVRAVG